MKELFSIPGISPTQAAAMLMIGFVFGFLVVFYFLGRR